MYGIEVGRQGMVGERAHDSLATAAVKSPMGLGQRGVPQDAANTVRPATGHQPVFPHQDLPYIVGPHYPDSGSPQYMRLVDAAKFSASSSVEVHTLQRTDSP